MTDLQIPAYLLARQSRGVADTLAANLGSGSPPYISIKGNRFTLVDAADNTRAVGAMDPKLGIYLDVVLIDSNPHTSKVYYAEAFDPNAAEMLPPTCFSDNGIGPSAQAQKPQSPTCAACPYNVWGSDTSKMTGKATKACNDVQKLAAILPGDSQGIVFLLRVPPASRKFLGKYAKSLRGMSLGTRAADLTDVVTRITFDPQAVGILNFTAVSFVDEATATRTDKLLTEKATLDIVGANDKPYQGAIAAPAASPAPERQLPPPPATTVSVQPVAESPVAAVANASAILTTGGTFTASGGGGSGAPKPRGRPRKDTAAAPAPAPTQAPFAPQQAAPEEDDIAIPSFLRREEPEQPKPAGAAFGMAEAPAPDEEMQRRIQAAFNLPTG